MIHVCMQPHGDGHRDVVDKHETKDRRDWALVADVVRALKRWRAERPTDAETTLVVGGSDDVTRHAAGGLRHDLMLAGADR